MNNINEFKKYSTDEIKLRYDYYCKVLEQKIKHYEIPRNKKYKQGFFLPKNHPEKCMNIMEVAEVDAIIWRSSWELKFMEWLDSNDAIIRWGSEIINIVYKNPIKGKTSFYVPDFYFEFINKQGKLEKYLIEIKPMSQSKLSETKDGYDRLRMAVNAFKWQSAIKYCKPRGITFKVLTEYDLGLK